MSVADLRKNMDKLNNAQQIGVRHFEDFEQRIPRKEMEELETVIIGAIKEIDNEYTAKICGSFRRGAESSGIWIYWLLTHPILQTIRKRLDC